jgi:hypothetical protein
MDGVTTLCDGAGSLASDLFDVPFLFFYYSLLETFTDSEHSETKVGQREPFATAKDHPEQPTTRVTVIRRRDEYLYQQYTTLSSSLLGAHLPTTFPLVL